MAKAALVSVSFVAAPALDEDGRNIYGYVGDHNDEVPDDNMTDGSWFLAKDTKKIYFFRTTSGKWEPMGGGDPL